MEKIEVRVGTEGPSGNCCRTKRFTGEEVESARTNEGARSRDDRGHDMTLYRVPDNRYRIHHVWWSRWQGESDEYSLSDPMTEAEVWEQFPALANAARLVEPVEDLD